MLGGNSLLVAILHVTYFPGIIVSVEWIEVFDIINDLNNQKNCEHEEET
jgi:hypothetical protein